MICHRIRPADKIMKHLFLFGAKIPIMSEFWFPELLNLGIRSNQNSYTVIHQVHLLFKNKNVSIVKGNNVF
jgi:hypothetical protein